MDEKMAAYEAEVKRMRDQYGPDAEVPMNPYGNLVAKAPRGAMPGLNTPVMPIEGRIAELTKQVAEAGHRLSMARATFTEAARSKDHERQMFIELTELLMQAIHEHREGTPEGVPYQS